jgi:hypothetical protein
MASEDIGEIYKTQIPGYEDAADIQAALKLYHYATTTVPTTEAEILPNSLAGHLKALDSRADALEALGSGSDYLTASPYPLEKPDGFIWVDANSTGNGSPVYAQAVYTNEAPTTELVDGIIWVDKDSSPRRAYIYNAGTSTWDIIDDIQSVIDNAGDILYGTANDTVGKLGIGTTGQVLTVSGGLPAWETPITPPSGGMTLIGTTTLTGVTNTIAIPTGYNNVQLVLRDIQGNTSTYLRVAAKPASGSPQHHWIQMRTGFSSVDSSSEAWATIMQFDSSSDQSVIIDLYDYNNSVSDKVMEWNAAYALSSGAIRRAAMGTAHIETTSPITQFVLTLESGGSMNGTALLYGVK